jgi:DNA polymerase III delta prime subunit
MSSVKNKLFEEVFCPKTLKAFVLPDRIKEKFTEKNSDDIILNDNFLFFGSSGLGKSSLAKYIGSHMNCFYLNASIDGGIETLRRGSELHDFCVTTSIFNEGKTKFVLLDEINGVSKQFYEGLKGFIDEFTPLGVRFIGTTNYIEDIEPAILSRLKPINFNLSIEEELVHKVNFKNRVTGILDKIGVKYDNNALDKLISKSYPDWRSVLSDLQFLYRSGKTEITEDVVKKDIYQYNQIYDIISSKNSVADLKEIMDVVRSYNNPTSIIRGIDRDLYDYYGENNKKMLFLVPHYSIIIAKYCDMMNRRVDPYICFKALLFELIRVREASNIK